MTNKTGGCEEQIMPSPFLTVLWIFCVCEIKVTEQHQENLKISEIPEMFLCLFDQP